jgi:hypothetical protein
MKKSPKVIIVLLLIVSMLTVYFNAGDFKSLFKLFLRSGGTVTLTGKRIDPRNGKEMCFVHVDLPGPAPEIDSILLMVADLIDVRMDMITEAGYVPGSGTYKDGKYGMDFAVNKSFCDSTGGPFGQLQPSPTPSIDPKTIRIVIGSLFIFVMVYVLKKFFHPNVLTSKTK